MTAFCLVFFVLAGICILLSMPSLANWYHSPDQITHRRRQAETDAAQVERQIAIRERERMDRERRKARGEVYDFYHRHRLVLEGQLPESLVEARIESGITDDTALAEAWGVTGDLILQMNAIVQEQRAAVKTQRRKAARLERQIAQHQARIASLQRSPLRAEVDGEILALSDKLADLERDRATLDDEPVEQDSDQSL